MVLFLRYRLGRVSGEFLRNSSLAQLERHARHC
jgi:hypothetical protein